LSDDDDQTASDERTAAQPSDAERAVLDLKQPRRRKVDRVTNEQREADEFWKGLLNQSPIARRELWRLVGESVGAHIFETRFPCGPVGFPDANAAWYARGEQDFGLRLYLHWLRLDPLAVAKMHQENDSRFAVKGE
jgi:hypothetical protein